MDMERGGATQREVEEDRQRERHTQTEGDIET